MHGRRLPGGRPADLLGGVLEFALELGQLGVAALDTRPWKRVRAQAK